MSYVSYILIEEEKKKWIVLMKNKIVFLNFLDVWFFVVNLKNVNIFKVYLEDFFNFYELYDGFFRLIN